MKVICISGKAGYGKDTVASLLKDAYEKQGKAVLITHFADLVKYICRTFLDWNGEKDEYGRGLLQTVGTEVFRTYRPDYWVSFIIDILRNYKDKWDYVMIPDWRFLNEAVELSNAGFEVRRVRVIRPNWHNGLLAGQKTHPSETSLDNYEVDYTVCNDSDLDSLAEKVNRLAHEI